MAAVSPVSWGRGCLPVDKRCPCRSGSCGRFVFVGCQAFLRDKLAGIVSQQRRDKRGVWRPPWAPPPHAPPSAVNTEGRPALCPEGIPWRPNQHHTFQADARRCIDAGLTLVQRRRRWTNVKPTSIYRLVSAGFTQCWVNVVPAPATLAQP